MTTNKEKVEEQQGAEGHIPKAEAQAIAHYCHELMQLLRLPQWTVLIMVDPSDDGTLANINPIDGRYVAQLHLCEDWMTLEDSNKLNTITHEICHLLHARVNHVVWETRDLMHDHEHQLVWQRYKMETEYMVDHIATFIDKTHKLQRTWDICFGREVEE